MAVLWNRRRGSPRTIATLKAPPGDVFLEPQGYRNALEQAENDFQKQRREEPLYHAKDELPKARTNGAAPQSISRISSRKDQVTFEVKPLVTNR